MRALGVLLLILWPAAAAAQTPRTSFAGGLPTPSLPLLETPSGAFVGSLVLPGAGQAALGLRRWVVFGALEVGLWAVHLEAAGDVRRLSTAYRDLAWNAARQPTSPGTRQEGSWGYYETMSQYLRSGAFDRDPSQPGLQPETDAATYNGSVWALARGLFLGPGPVDPASPGYDEALAYYREQAVGPDFLWTWAASPDALDRFRGLIQDADAEARLRTVALGLVLANHMVSAVDALIAGRLRATTDIRLTSRLEPDPMGYRWHVGLEIPLMNGHNGHQR